MDLTGKFIKHKKFIDICINITYMDTNNSSLIIHGIFWNLGFVESFNIGKKVNLNIINKNEWLILSDKGMKDKCFRYSKWSEL